MNINKLRSEVGKKRNGFTLIELLIVIGILAVLATVVIVALNPLQNLAKTRDAGRLDTITQLGHAAESRATSNNGVYIDLAAACAGGAAHNTWITCLTNVAGGSGEINVIPAVIAYSIANTAACNFNAGAMSTTQSVQNGFCYKQTGAPGVGPMIIYARAEAASNSSRCPAASPIGWLIYSSADGKAGIVCTANATTEPAVIAGGQTFF